MRSKSRSFALSLFRPHRGSLALGTFFLLLGVISNLVLPWILGSGMDQSSILYYRTHSRELGGCLALLFALQGVFFYFRTFFFQALGHRVVADVRKRVYEKVMASSAATFDQEKPNEMVALITSDASLLQDAVGVRFSVFLRYSLQAVSGIVLMGFLSPLLTSLVLLFLLCLTGTSMVWGRRLRGLTKRQQEKLSLSALHAEDTFSQFKTVKVYEGEMYEVRKNSGLIDDVFVAGIRRSRISALFQSVVPFLLNCGLIAFSLYGLRLVHTGSLDSSTLLRFVAYGAIIGTSFTFIASSLSDLSQGLGAAERIEDVLNRLPPPHQKEKSSLQELTTWSGKVTFSRVTFSYPQRSDIIVLNNLSFTLQPHAINGLVGPSGAGKSTIIQLILGLYESYEGEILFDELPLRNLEATSTRRKCAYVPQDTLLFDTTIRANVVYGSESASDNDVRRALKGVNLNDVVASLPQGVETLVGAKGSQLSGGQRQRILLARALLRNPALILLDEPTSALDEENEDILFTSLKDLFPHQTLLVATHNDRIMARCSHLIKI
jgi:ABC-type multidrug transport system fused ATPase/permease subunit